MKRHLIVCCLLLLSSSVLAQQTGTSSDNWPPPAWTPGAEKPIEQDLGEMFRFLVQEALKRGQPELLAAHFRSMALVVEAYGDDVPAVAREIRKEYLDNWDDGPTRWKAYHSREPRRPLYLAWKSEYDDVVSVTRVVLPKNWKRDRHYPLYFELHGKGPSRPLGQKTMGFVSRDKGVGLASFWDTGFHVYPLNRNSAYRGIGEIDLWECLEQVDFHLRTDPQRQYLFGFSLGACGTFMFGPSSIDKRGWAAVAAFSPVPVHTPWAASKLRNTPVWICYGEKEWPHRLRKCQTVGLKPMRELLKEYGNEPEFLLIPDTGHKYDGEYQKKMLEFLSSHTNESPVLPKWENAEVHAFGDDEIELYVNQEPLILRPGKNTGTARVKDGRNVVAVRLRNKTWAGGMYFAAELGDGTWWISDGSWKCTYKEPEGDWKSEDFDDSDWGDAGDLCALKSWSGFSIHEEQLESLVDKGVRFIGPPPVQHYRKVFESDGGEGQIKIKGDAFHHRLWLNGELIGEGDQHAVHPEKPGKKTPNWPTVTYPCSTARGRNVIALEIRSASTNGKGVYMKAAVYHPHDGGIGRVRTGAGWRVSPVAEKGWMQSGFDDSDWTRTDYRFINAASQFWRDPTGPHIPTAHTLWPGDLYFRKVFTLGESNSASDDTPSEKE